MTLMQGRLNGTCATTDLGAIPENSKDTQSSNLCNALNLSGQLMQLPCVPAGDQEFPKQETQTEWFAAAAVPAGQMRQMLESDEVEMLPALHD
jgi:hypothetical protein